MERSHVPFTHCPTVNPLQNTVQCASQDVDAVFPSSHASSVLFLSVSVFNAVLSHVAWVYPPAQPRPCRLHHCDLGAASSLPQTLPPRWQPLSCPQSIRLSFQGYVHGITQPVTFRTVFLHSAWLLKTLKLLSMPVPCSFHCWVVSVVWKDHSLLDHF